MIKSEKELIEYVASTSPWDAVVVEGYDGVGKGKIVSALAEAFSVVPYRPDYNFWIRHGLKAEDRWKLSGYFWDIYSHFDQEYRSHPMIFDRGVVSGAVYNNDLSIAKDYKLLVRDKSILHVLVTCDEDSYHKFAESRGVEVADYSVYEEFTSRYIESLEIAGVQYVMYFNKYDDSLSESLRSTCAGCGHYSYGKCTHPKIYRNVDSKASRCQYSHDKEVQDV